MAFCLFIKVDTISAFGLFRRERKFLFRTPTNNKVRPRPVIASLYHRHRRPPLSYPEVKYLGRGPTGNHRLTERVDSEGKHGQLLNFLMVGNIKPKLLPFSSQLFTLRIDT